MKATDKAYIAGLIDGEGYVGIKKLKPYKYTGRVHPGYTERIQVRMVDEPAIKFIAEMCGGWYYREKPSCKNGRPLFCYQASDGAAAKILKTLLPYLRVKKEQAKTVLLLRRHKDLPRSQTMVKVPVSITGRWGKVITVRRERHCEKTIQYRELLWQKCKDLNKVGV